MGRKRRARRRSRGRTRIGKAVRGFGQKFKRALKKPTAFLSLANKRHPFHKAAMAVAAIGGAKAVAGAAKTGVRVAKVKRAGSINLKNAFRPKPAKKLSLSKKLSFLKRRSGGPPRRSNFLTRLRKSNGTKVGKASTPILSRVSKAAGKRPVSFKGKSTTALIRAGKAGKALLLSSAAAGSKSSKVKAVLKSIIGTSNLKGHVKHAAVKALTARTPMSRTSPASPRSGTIRTITKKNISGTSKPKNEGDDQKWYKDPSKLVGAAASALAVGFGIKKLLNR